MKLIHKNSAQVNAQRVKLILSDRIIATGTTTDICIVKLISSRFDHFIETLRTIRIDGQFQKCRKNCTIIVIHRRRYFIFVTIFITCLRAKRKLSVKFHGFLKEKNCEFALPLLSPTRTACAFAITACCASSPKYFNGIIFRMSGKRFACTK